MARIISVHEYDLKPGSSAERFEQEIRAAEARGLFELPGLTAHHFVKGVRGAGPHARGEAWFRPAEADANSPSFWGKRLRLGRRR